MRGGKRYNAGRSGWRRRCENVLALDLRRIRQTGRLVPGGFTWSWTRDGERLASITAYVSADKERMNLSYSWTPDGQPREPIAYDVLLAWTPCRFGGRRAWFCCLNCGSRRLVLYGISSQGRFLCRRCMRLGYTSESESPLDRAWRKTRKLEDRLTEDGQRPKGMRKRTFERIVAQLDAAEERKDSLWSVGFVGFCLRSGLIPGEVLKEAESEVGSKGVV